MTQIKQRIIGAVGAVLIALAAFGVHTLVGFRNDYLKIRAEHEVLYGYFARVLGKEEQTGKPITRTALIEALLVEKYGQKK